METEFSILVAPSPKHLVVLRGIPGSGKSTLATPARWRGASVRSADDWFTKNGIYAFNPAEISDAHGACFLSVIRAMQRVQRLIVVDNTNTTAVEIAPYVLSAQAFGYTHEIVTILCEPAIATARCLHDVPAERIEAMASAIRTETLPPWWVQRTLSDTTTSSPSSR